MFFVCILVLDIWESPQRAQSSYLEAMKELNGLNDDYGDYYSDYFDDDDDYYDDDDDDF